MPNGTEVANDPVNLLLIRILNKSEAKKFDLSRCCPNVFPFLVCTSVRPLAADVSCQGLMLTVCVVIFYVCVVDDTSDLSLLDFIG